MQHSAIQRVLICGIMIITLLSGSPSARAATKPCADQSLIDQLTADVRSMTQITDDVVTTLDPQSDSNNSTGSGITTAASSGDFRGEVMQGLLTAATTRQRYEDLDVSDQCAELVASAETLFANDSDLFAFALVAIDNPSQDNHARIQAQSQRIDDILSSLADQLHTDFLSDSTPAATSAAAN